MGRMIAIGGGDIPSTISLGRYALSLTFLASPKILFVSANQQNFSVESQIFRLTYASCAKEIRITNLFSPSFGISQFRRLLSWSNAIFLGDGHWNDILTFQKLQQVGMFLADIYHEDTAVLIGLGTGAMCFFCSGYGHHQGQEQFLEGMFEIQHGVFCPQYEQIDQEQFDLHMGLQRMCGYALESHTAFVDHTGTRSFIKSSEDAHVYRFCLTQRWIQKKEFPCIFLQ